jgi:hypothetical protein
MKEILFSNWHAMRIIRLVLGIVVFIMALQQQQTILAIAGGWFSLMALLNLGCSAEGCNYRPPVRRNFQEPTSFEEITTEKKD